MQKNILITGATAGIGQATAELLAEQGYHIIIHGRNATKAKQVVQAIKMKTGNPNVEAIIADLFSMAAIQQMVVDFNQRFDHLDVLINNAGAVFDNQRAVSTDGIETTMALNVIAPFLLTQLLLPALKRSQAGRIINMSSASHRASGRPDMTDLNFEQPLSAQRRYSLAKLFVIWNTQYQAKQLRQQNIKNVTVNVSHPGSIATNFGQDSDKGFWVNLVYKAAIKLSQLTPLKVMATPVVGASTNVFLATSPTVAKISGAYWGNSKQRQPFARYDNPANEQALWTYCLQVVQPFLNTTA